MRSGPCCPVFMILEDSVAARDLISVNHAPRSRLTDDQCRRIDRALTARVVSMRCMLCGEEMRLVRATRDEALLVPGFEHHVLNCPSCHDEETRLVFVDPPAPLSPSAATGEIKADRLDAPLQPSIAAADDETPGEITVVPSEKMLPIASLPPAAPPSPLAKAQTARSPSAKVWGRKAELHRARWGLLCGRLGLRPAAGKPDTPTKT
jgi:hypothetical protein